MPWDVVIVGGGASGALVAATLRRSAGPQLRLVLIDACGPHGFGLAYRTPEPWHLLNVPAGRMSAFIDDPLHFVRWLRHENPGVRETDFVPRRQFGEYLGGLLREEETAGARVERRLGEVVHLSPGREQITVRLKSGETLDARAVVMAIGHFPSTPLPVPDGGLYQSLRYISSPFDQALRKVFPDEPVLLLGTGLTAVDAALSLSKRGHSGPLHALSRHGLLPQAHLPSVMPLASLTGEPPLGLRALVRWVRSQSREAQYAGGNWRDVIEALRPRIVQLWQGLTRVEQHRFLRHLRAYWDIHRHRMAPEVASGMESLTAYGQLRVHAGRVLGFVLQDNGVTVTFRPRGGRAPRSLKVGYVVNCMGPAPDLRQMRSPLLRQMLVDGIVRADPLDIGLDATNEGNLLAASGRAQPRLFALGPPLRGLRWESTAVPEIRAQANELTRVLLRLQATDRVLEPNISK